MKIYLPSVLFFQWNIPTEALIPFNDSENEVPIVRALVVNSKEASPGRYPYFVKNKNSSCGAVLIHKNVVLTAGHCQIDRAFTPQVKENKGKERINDYCTGIDDIIITTADGAEKNKVCITEKMNVVGLQMPFDVDVGLHNNNVGAKDGETVSVNGMIIHQEWLANYILEKGRLATHLFPDIALLRLGSPSSKVPVTLDDGTKVLQEKSGSTKGTEFTVLGFGKDDEFFNTKNFFQELNFPKNLQEGKTTLISQTNCYKDVTSVNHCTEATNLGGGCGQDSGGPHILKGKEAKDDLLVGLVKGSAGAGKTLQNDPEWCKQYPGVCENNARVGDCYSRDNIVTSVRHSLSWIREKMCEEWNFVLPQDEATSECLNGKFIKKNNIDSRNYECTKRLQGNAVDRSLLKCKLWPPPSCQITHIPINKVVKKQKKLKT